MSSAYWITVAGAVGGKEDSMRYAWTRQEVDDKLKQIMQSIHDQAFEAAEHYGAAGNYVAGANIAGFVKVANTMMDQGVV